MNIQLHEQMNGYKNTTTVSATEVNKWWK